MKNYIDITGKYLKGQKKRSVLTVIGIILSTALITGIGSIYTSMFDANLRATIHDNGDYYAAVKNVTADKISRLTQNVETEKAGVAQPLGFAAYAENKSNGKDPPHKYLQVQAMDPGAISMLPYRLSEGRMPAAPGEIVLDNWTLKFMQGVGIGSKVTLSLGARTLPDGTAAKDESISDPKETFTKTGEATYTVVGLLKPDYVLTTNFARALAYLDSGSLPDGQKYTVYMKLTGTSDIQGRIRHIVSAAGIDASGEAEGNPAIRFNDRLLRLYAQSVNQAINDTVVIMLVIVTSLVVLATIAVIYNAFNISVVERVTQFGLLRCVGATPRQIRNIIFREALTLGVIGIPIGVFCGTVAMDVVFRVVTMIAPDMIYGGGSLRLVLSPAILIASVLLSAATIYISALLPARKAGRISPMEAVRGAGAFRKEKFRPTDKRRVVLAAFGAEGWMAWKNIGRNRKRFYITTFSMVVSIVLFIVFSSLVGFAYGSGAVGQGDVPSYLIWSNNKIELTDQDYNEMRAIAGVDYLLRCADANGNVTLPKDKVNARAYGLLPEATTHADASGNVTLFNSTVRCYGDESVDVLMRKLGITSMDKEAFLNGQGVILVNGAAMTDKKNKRSVLTDMTTLSSGDTFMYAGTNSDSLKDEMLPQKQLKVLAVVTDGLAGAVRNENGGVNFIVSEKLFADATRDAAFPSSLMIMMDKTSDRAEMNQFLDNEIGALYNVIDYDESAKSMTQVWTVLSIFLYGFVAVISLIGCLNIINTISTNIIIRTRELSVLRAIGMFEGGIRRMVAWESILHSAAAAVIGAVIGTALSFLIYSSMISAREFPWELPWRQILIAVSAAALVAVISGFVPLRRINNGVIMEGIRGEE